MALLATQSITSAGLTPTTVAASGGGDTITPAGPDDSRTFLYILNSGGSSITVTVADPGKTPAGNSGSAPAITVAAGAPMFIPIPGAAINTSTGVASVTYSGVTSVTVAAVRR